MRKAVISKINAKPPPKVGELTYLKDNVDYCGLADFATIDAFFKENLKNFQVRT